METNKTIGETKQTTVSDGVTETQTIRTIEKAEDNKFIVVQTTRGLRLEGNVLFDTEEEAMKEMKKMETQINRTDKSKNKHFLAACRDCGGWTDVGGMSHHYNTPMGCDCTGEKKETQIEYPGAQISEVSMKALVAFLEKHKAIESEEMHKIQMFFENSLAYKRQLYRKDSWNKDTAEEIRTKHKKMVEQSFNGGNK